MSSKVGTPGLLKRFYAEVFGIDVDADSRRDDPTILRHEPEGSETVFLNYFDLLMVASEEEGSASIRIAVRKRLDIYKKVDSWKSLRRNSFSQFQAAVLRGITSAAKCLSDESATIRHREELYEKRCESLEQRLLTMPPDGKSAEPRIRADAKLMGFISTTENRAVAELKQKHPLYFVARPKFTSALRVSITEFDLFRYKIEATENPTGFSASPLPTGWRCNPSTGEIYGLAPAHGKLSIKLEATNAAGPGTATLTIDVLQAKPEITSPPTATAFVRRPFSYQITASHNPTSFAASNLPAGLAVDTMSGVISGKPLKVGKWSPTIEASNAGGTGSRELEIDVLLKPGPGPFIWIWRWFLFVIESLRSLLKRKPLTTVKVPVTRVSPALLTSAGVLVVLGVVAAFIPFPREIRTDLSLLTNPPQSMPAWSQFSRSPRSISTKMASSVWRILFPSKHADSDLGSLNDGRPETGWTFCSRQAAHPVTMDFGKASAIEGVIVLNGVRNLNESRVDSILLKFDDGTERTIPLQDTGDWQYVLFDASTSQRIAVSAKANKAVVGRIAEMWFLERIDTNFHPELWEGGWKSREGASLHLKAMTSGWFEGWLKTESGDRQLFVRTLPVDLNGGPSLAGSIAQGAGFVPQIEAQKVLLRRGADEVTVEIELSSSDKIQVLSFQRLPK